MRKLLLLAGFAIVGTLFTNADAQTTTTVVLSDVANYIDF